MTTDTDTIRVFVPLTIRKRNGRPRILPPADYRPSQDRTQGDETRRTVRGRAGRLCGREPPAAACLSRTGGAQASDLRARGACRDAVDTDRCRGPAVARTAGAGVRLIR